MGTHASFLVVDEATHTAAYGYEHFDGQEMAETLIEFSVRRNRVNAWQCRDGDDELWPVTPAEFVIRWHAERLAEHQRYGRTGSGLTIRAENVEVVDRLHTEYGHLVIVTGAQVRSVRRVYNAEYGHGGSYTVAFDDAPLTDAPSCVQSRPALLVF